MKNLFVIEHSITKNEDGSSTIELFKVFLKRMQTRKKYAISHFEGAGTIKFHSTNTVDEVNIKDLFVIRYLNHLYLNEQSGKVTPELITEMVLQLERVKRD